MKVGILRIGQIESHLLERVQENLRTVFQDGEFVLTPDIMQLPTEAYDEKRKQYRSDVLLTHINDWAEKVKAERLLGMVEADISVPRMIYVFGEAERPGKAAVISLFRLRPEFYGQKADVKLLVERASKEAVHELGHTLGLGHCSNPFCVMYFSNSIFDTDRKQSLFCSKCYVKIEAALKAEKRG